MFNILSFTLQLFTLLFFIEMGNMLHYLFPILKSLHKHITENTGEWILLFNFLNYPKCHQLLDILHFEELKKEKAVLEGRRALRLRVSPPEEGIDYTRTVSAWAKLNQNRSQLLSWLIIMIKELTYIFILLRRRMNWKSWPTYPEWLYNMHLSVVTENGDKEILRKSLYFILGII